MLSLKSVKSVKYSRGISYNEFYIKVSLLTCFTCMHLLLIHSFIYTRLASFTGLKKKVQPWKIHHCYNKCCTLANASRHVMLLLKKSYDRLSCYIHFCTLALIFIFLLNTSFLAYIQKKLNQPGKK